MTNENVRSEQFEEMALELKEKGKTDPQGMLAMVRKLRKMVDACNACPCSEECDLELQKYALTALHDCMILNCDIQFEDSDPLMNKEIIGDPDTFSGDTAPYLYFLLEKLDKMYSLDCVSKVLPVREDLAVSGEDGNSDECFERHA